MNVRPLAVALLLMALPGVLAAQEQRGGDPSEAVGPETRTWVDLQASGAAASPVARPMPGDIAERVYKRHADSFAHPIPEELGRESFVSEGGGK